jgi:hypothetical protein
MYTRSLPPVSFHIILSNQISFVCHCIFCCICVSLRTVLKLWPRSLKTLCSINQSITTQFCAVRSLDLLPNCPLSLFLSVVHSNIVTTRPVPSTKSCASVALHYPSIFPVPNRLQSSHSVAPFTKHLKLLMTSLHLPNQLNLKRQILSVYMVKH